MLAIAVRLLYGRFASSTEFIMNRINNDCWVFNYLLYMVEDLRAFSTISVRSRRFVEDFDEFCVCLLICARFRQCFGKGISSFGRGISSFASSPPARSRRAVMEFRPGLYEVVSRHRAPVYSLSAERRQAAPRRGHRRALPSRGGREGPQRPTVAVSNFDVGNSRDRFLFYWFSREIDDVKTLSRMLPSRPTKKNSGSRAHVISHSKT